MAVTAPIVELPLAGLARLLPGLPLPEAAAPARQSRMPDIVVFSSAPMRLLSDLASTGLRQLGTILPALRLAAEAGDPAPLGHLARAASAAARQIGEGHAALFAEGADRVAVSLQSLPAKPEAGSAGEKQSLRILARQLGAEPAFGQSAPAGPEAASAKPLRPAMPDVDRETGASKLSGREQDVEPPPDASTREVLRAVARQLGAAADPSVPRTDAGPDADPVRHWLGEAKRLLGETANALDAAEAQVRPLLVPSPETVPQPSASWVLAQIVAAQSGVAAALAALPNAPTRFRPVAPYGAAMLSTLAPLAGAAGLVGAIVLALALWLAEGVWVVVAYAAAIGAAGLWALRIGRAARGVTLDARR